MEKASDRIFYVPQMNTHCGDNICCLSACLEFAERMDGIVYVDFFRDVVEAYNNPRLRFGYYGNLMTVKAALKHRQKVPGLFENILGTYYAEFGLPIVNPVLRLPKFEACEPRALIQPLANFTLNPPTWFLQKMVDSFVGMTGLEVFAVGNANTPQILKNVNYSLLKDDLLFMMQQVQNAICVLTPRSLCANLAAGYHVPAFMWSPLDGEDWHLNYKDGKLVKCNWEPVAGAVEFNPCGNKGNQCENIRMVDSLENQLAKFVHEYGLIGKQTVNIQGMEKKEQTEEQGEEVEHDGDSKQDIGIEQRLEAD